MGNSNDSFRFVEPCFGLWFDGCLDFSAMIFPVVHIGAIAVSFLFVVMMFNIQIAEIHEEVLRYLPKEGEAHLPSLGTLLGKVSPPSFFSRYFTWKGRCGKEERSGGVKKVKRSKPKERKSNLIQY
ncbi:ATP synthase subunit a [Zea mays]|uniref:ATP synthase subunit a n=1 Tax=Zea mays TaxID=4577 RepID=A0A1D6LIY0_MAIZE|nr:ATP synthase subunit a [Zea mays]